LTAPDLIFEWSLIEWFFVGGYSYSREATHSRSHKKHTYTLK